MRVMRAFVDGPLAVGESIALPEDAATHLVRVLRLREGDGCVLFNGNGHDYAATLVSIGKREVRARIEAMAAIDNESPLRITLLQGIARGEKMDWILQKATELGVAGVVPVASERSLAVVLGRGLHRQDRVDTHHGRVVVIEAARAGTDSEGDHPLGLGHLLIDALHDRRNFVTDRAHDEKDVGLARRKSG